MAASSTQSDIEHVNLHHTVNNNQLCRLENLHHLQRLKVLRVGDNRLSRREDVVYLRKLGALRTLSIKGNPLCQEDEDCKGFVTAMLPKLVYLECHHLTEVLMKLDYSF